MYLQKATLDAQTKKEAGPYVLFVVKTKYEYYILDFSTIYYAFKKRITYVVMCYVL